MKSKCIVGYFLAVLATVFSKWLMAGTLLKITNGVVYDNFYSITLIEIAINIPFYILIGMAVISLCRSISIISMFVLGMICSSLLLYPYSFLEIDEVILSNIFMETWIYSPSLLPVFVYPFIAFVWSKLTRKRHQLETPRSN